MDIILTLYTFCLNWLKNPDCLMGVLIKGDFWLEEVFLIIKKINALFNKKNFNNINKYNSNEYSDNENKKRKDFICLQLDKNTRAAFIGLINK